MHKRKKIKSLQFVALLLVVLIGGLAALPLLHTKAEVNISKIGSFGGSATLANIVMPGQLASDDDGNIYVLDKQSRGVVKMSGAGEYIRNIGNNQEYSGDNSLGGVKDISVHRGSNTIYTIQAENRAVKKFSTDGAFIGTFGIGVLDGQDTMQYCTVNCRVSDDDYADGYSPIDQRDTFTTDTAGNVYLTGSNTINKFSPTGQLQAVIGWGAQDGEQELQYCTSGCRNGAGGVGDGQFDNTTRSIAVDEQGNIYVAGTNRIQKISASGEFLGAYGLGVQDGQAEYQVCPSSCIQGVGGAAIWDIAVSDGKLYSTTESDDRETMTLNSYNLDGSNPQVVGTPSCDKQAPAGLNNNFCYGRGLDVSVDGDINLGDWGPNGDAQRTNSSDGWLTREYNIYERAPGMGVLTLKADGTAVRRIASDVRSPGKFATPVGNAVDSEGNVYVVDTLGDRVQKFDSNGNLLFIMGEAGTNDGQFLMPISAAVDSENNVYVTDSRNSRVVKFNGSDGEPLGVWGNTPVDSGGYRNGGSEEENFNRPTGIAIDSNDNIYISDTENYRVKKMNTSGEVLGVFGTDDQNVVTQPGQEPWFQEPAGIAIANDGNILVVDAYRIQKINPSGNLVSNVGKTLDSNGTAFEQDEDVILQGSGIATDRNGNTYVVDSFIVGNNLKKFDSEGNYVGHYDLGPTYTEFGSLPGAALGVSVGKANGILYVSNSANARVDVLCDNQVSPDDCTGTQLPPEEGQGEVAVTNAVNGKKISISQTGCQLITNAAGTKSSNFAKQDGNTYPAGFIGFALTGCNTGGSSVVTVTFEGVDSKKNVALRKYNTVTQAYTTVPNVVFNIVKNNNVSSLQAVYTVSDGGTLDEDGIANGVIVDPVGLTSSEVLGNTGAVAISAVLLLSLTLGTSLYVWFDYRKHKKPLLQEDPTVRYTLANHIKVVTLPLLTYRLRFQIERVNAAGSSRVRRF